MGRVYVGRIVGAGGEVADEAVLARTEEGLEISTHGGAAAIARVARALEERGVRVIENGVRPHFLARTWLAFRVLSWKEEGILDASWDGVVDALARPRRVVLAGAPNAGKSSLFNALLERERALVSPEPGTTRDVIEEPCAVEGVPIVLCDAAGVRDGAADELERAAAALAKEAIAAADLVIEVVDGSMPPPPPGEGARHITVLTKSDLPHRVSIPGALRVSALSGEGLPALALALAARILGRDPREIARP